MMKPPYIAVFTYSFQSGFDTSSIGRAILAIEEKTTVAEIIEWVNSKKDILAPISLGIEELESVKPEQ